MKITEAGDTFNCDCGFSWQRGFSGSHNCGVGLRKQITDLKAQVLTNREAQPVAGTQVKPVADLFALGWDNGEVCAYTTEPEKAVLWLTGYTGTCVQEYVKLGRLQDASTAPPAPAVPNVIAIPEAATLTNINQLCPLDNDLSQTDFATGWNDCRQHALTHDELPPVIKGVHCAAQGWNACRTAMLAQPQSEPQNIPNNILGDLVAAVNRLFECDGTRGQFSAIKCSDAREEIERLLTLPVSQGYKLNPPDTPDGWISCEDRMPEDGEVVLVIQEGGIIYCAEVEGGVLYPDEFPRVPTQGKEITHWMPLPAAPTQGEKQ
ncbi:DUF551 domain-containing protein [Serratia liquefaciens]|uniref:DUF551 domain-containing protein n=1 Tax=Serratia liquefaciens TaxID=614 RepID=A0A515CSS1_SERLI|nr:DUF551 domain-containing protein [Serratia liquefaciens]QDL31150.1 DUF551 domain-containing protein [Serratia liquefaciens]